MDKRIDSYYSVRSNEKVRLHEESGWIEFERTRELICRHLPEGSLRILDVGGAAGIHAGWLAERGHNVHLIDPIARHIREAREAASRLDNPFTSDVGDARRLAEDDASVDVVQLLGPLYHLTERNDRIRALSESRRVLRPGGLCFVAAISRFASLFSGLAWGLLADPAFQQIVDRDLRDGQHRNPSDHPAWFTTAYFHHPDELESEAIDARFHVEGVFGIEGMAGWIAAATDRWDISNHRELILEAARATESEPSLRGLSSHMLLVARKPAEGS